MRVTPPIHPDLQIFLDHARSMVKSEDISDHVMNDPGSHGYFRCWENIRCTGQIPVSLDFDLTEGMASLAVGEPKKERNPAGFLAYRRFTHAVGLVLISWDWTNEDEFIILNYLALNLIRDLIPGDRSYLRMVRKAAAALSSVLKDCPDSSGYPFLLLAEIILAQKDQDFIFADQTGGTLLEAESNRRRRNAGVDDNSFLLGATCYVSLHREWLEACRELINPNSNAYMELLIGLLDELRVWCGGSR